MAGFLQMKSVAVAVPGDAYGTKVNGAVSLTACTTLTASCLVYRP